MKKYGLIAVFVATMLLTFGVSLSFAQNEAAVKAEEPVGVTLKGVNYCLLKTLAQEEMAAADPAYVSMNALQVTEAADTDGNDLPELAGQTLHYLPSSAAEPVLMGEAYQDAQVEIIGRWYKKANALLVEEIQGEAAQEEDIWDIVGVGGKSGVQVLGEGEQ